MQPNEPEIKNQNQVTDDSIVLKAVNLPLKFGVFTKRVIY